MPNFFCGSLVVVRCGPQGLSVLFDRPGDRTAAVAAGYSYLLVSKGSAKTIRMSLSREQPPARVERAQQEQDFTAQKHAPFRLWRLGKQHAVCPRLRTPLPASRSGHAGFRLFSFRSKRECGGLKPLPGAIVGFCASCLSRTHPSRRVSRRTIPARCRSRETKARLKVVRNGAGLLANPRIGARFER